jgi:DNA polymerase theta
LNNALTAPQRIFETGKKALLILPFISLAREKMFHLQSLLRDAGIRVEGFMGGQAPAGGLKVTDVAVATIERANSLVNRMMEEKTLDQLTCVVVDELHMLGDHSRGYLLELLLTKVLYTAGPGVQVSQTDLK